MATIDPTLFKVYDVRATVDRLTPAAARLIGRGVGSLARERGFRCIAVGRDGRLSSPALAAALISGLTECGIEVLDIGLAATPLLYFAARQHADGCGAVVTGSHNPPEYNGIKLMLGGETIDGAELQALRERIETGDFHSGEGKVKQLLVAADYIEAVCANLTLSRKLKIVIDCGNGVAGALAPELYRHLGCELVPLYCEVDGNFPHHHPDPQLAANLRDLQRMVIAEQADLGLAFDGDGDRLGVVSRSGQIVPGDTLLALFARADLAEQPGGLILYDVKSSRLVAQQVALRGGRSQVIPTGHSHMKRALKTLGAQLAGELSGHFAFAGWDVDDALYAGARLLKLVAGGLDVDAELASFPCGVVSPELQLPLSEDGHARVKRIAATACFPTAEHVYTVDGLRVEYADGFGLIRASNTTPVLTLRIEADNREAFLRIRDELAAALAPLSLPDWIE